ncbi:MAG: hypothetical protein HY426_02805 [Candidatus Levybacteria bacterium]|nr:hypothetical protein [Candidatus Levybacteria bacterium]
MVKEAGAFSPEPSWSDVEQYTRSLRDLIEASGFQPDYHVWISRGGIVPGVLLSHLMPWKPSFMVGVRKEGERRVVQDSPHINWDALRDKKVLLVEDHLETGRSAIALKEHLESYGARVKLACYSASDKSEINPDFVLARGVNIPPLYPWERFRTPQP